MLKDKISKILLLLLVVAPSLAVAQRDIDRDSQQRLVRLERSVSQLQRTVDDLSYRLQRVEDLLDDGGRRQPLPPVDVTFACMIVDSGHTKTFLGTDKSKIDAEYNARNKCSQSVHSSYCANGKLTCDDNLDSRGRGYVCVVTDSGNGRTFRGEGITSVAAEANAKMACQSSVHSSYCGNVIARCEEVF